MHVNRKALGFLTLNVGLLSDYNSSSVCLSECPGLPLLSGKHYRISLENLSKPAPNSTFKGSSLFSYCIYKKKISIVLIPLVWSVLLFLQIFFNPWAAPEILLNVISSSSSSFSLTFLCRDSTEGHPFLLFKSLLFDFLTFDFSVSPVYLFSRERCWFQLQPLRDGRNLPPWLTFVSVSLSCL